jgi:hypothetical protein
MADVHDIRDPAPDRPAGPNQYRASAGLWWGLLIGWGLAVAFFILLCIWGRGPHNAGGGYALEPPSAILENPADFNGHAVAVAGVVDYLLGPHAFTIDGGPGTGLVLFTPPSAAPTNAPAPARGEVAEAQGHIRLFDRKAAEQYYHLQIPDQLAQALQGKPILVVDHLVCMPREAALVTPEPRQLTTLRGG